MKRRDLLKLGAITTTGVLAPAMQAGCVAVPRSLATLSGASGAAEFNAMLDEQLARLATPGLLQKMVVAQTKKPLSATAEQKIAKHDELFRELLGTLLISQGFRDLPPETQVESGVQDRMWSHMDQIGGSVFKISDLLASLGQNQRSAIRTKLKEQPDLPMAIGETLHASATRAGMTTKRKAQLRAMMVQSQFRLTHADPGVVIDEYVDKVERHRASSERDTDAIDLARQIGEREFWRYQHLMQDPAAPATGGAAPAPVSAPPSPAAPLPLTGIDPVVQTLYASSIRAARAGRCNDLVIYGAKIKDIDPAFYAQVFVVNPEVASCVPRDGREAPPPAPAYEPTKPKPGEKGLRAGGYMLGIGLIFGVVGALLIAAEAFVGVIAITIAVILFGIGLIVLLISALIMATSGD